MTKSLLDDILDRVNEKSPDARKAIVDEAHKATKNMVWLPNPGPQTDAYLSDADIILYGGQAGGGKTHLILGIGVNEANNGIIFRRELSQTDGLEREGKGIIREAARFNGKDLEWNWSDGKTLKLGGMQGADDWIQHAGRERDYMAFDEAGEFLEIQVASIIAWLRAEAGRRTRLILASNPPRTSDGLWLLDWFAPWLDPHFPERARPGDIRWAYYADGKTVWVNGPGQYENDGKTYTAKSRTFIPASLADNPYRNNPEYRATLESLPEPLRSQLLYGDFTAGLKDSANQLIPTEWVRAAIARWTQNPPAGIPMCSIGVDCSGGGDDQMVMAPRNDGWFAPLIKTPGRELPKDRLGAHAAGIVLSHRRDSALVVVDMGGGYGGSLLEHLEHNNVETMAYKGAEATTKRTSDGKLTFVNVRSAAYWGFREALDPGQPGGSPIALPNDSRLIAGLCAVTFEITPRGIKAEPKSKREGGVKGVVERLGFSPDEADAVIMSWWGGPRQITHALDWAEQRHQRTMRGTTPKVVLDPRRRR